jgi:hypothetical protein
LPWIRPKITALSLAEEYFFDKGAYDDEEQEAQRALAHGEKEFLTTAVGQVEGRQQEGEAQSDEQGAAEAAHVGHRRQRRRHCGGVEAGAASHQTEDDEQGDGRHTAYRRAVAHRDGVEEEGAVVRRRGNEHGYGGAHRLIAYEEGQKGEAVVVKGGFFHCREV